MNNDFSNTLRKLYHQLCEKQKTLANHLQESKSTHPESKLMTRYMTAINKIKLEIRDLVSMHPSDKPKVTLEEGCCTLQYTHTVTKVILSFLHKQHLRDSTLIQSPHKLYREVLKCMVLTDCGHEAELRPLLKELFTKATPVE